MVMDIRRYAKKDLWSKLTLVSSNMYSEGGVNPIRIISKAGEVEGDQVGVIVGVNSAGEVGRDQGGVIAVVNNAKEVGRDQGGEIVGVNYAGEVGGDQSGLVVGVNYAKKVRLNQGGLVVGVNYAGEVEGTQVGILNIQTRNKFAKQRGWVRYNPLEGIGLGSSVWTKIKDTEKFLDKLSEKETPDKYKSILECFSNYSGKSWTKSITGHNTKKDILGRQTRKRLNQLELAVKE